MSKYKTIQAAVAALGLVLGGIYYLEDNVNRAYNDEGGVATICAGITSSVTPVNLGDVLDDVQCYSLNKAEAERTTEWVRKTVGKQDPYVEAALVWYVYNIGRSAFVNESLVYKRLKANDLKGACDAFVYKKANGKLGGFIHVKGHVSKGLVNRRTTEQEYCRKGIK